MLVVSPSAAQLDRLDTGQLTLIYFDFTESYLVPHAVQSFLKSIEFQRQTFGFDPKERVYVLLADFTDSADAGASVTPRNRLSIQIAPLGYAFETIAANDRIILIMNHELVHVATMGQPAGADKVFRTLFGGKVATHQGAAGDRHLRLPDRAARGRAPVVPRRDRGVRRHVDGRRHRPGPGRLGRDGLPRDGEGQRAHLRPARARVRGDEIDFQLQINAYLYGTRFMTWLAYRYSPEQLVEWIARKPGSKAYYASQFKQVFNRSIEDAWAEWIAFEKGFQQKNLEAIRKYRSRPTRTCRSARWDRSRAPTTTRRPGRSTPAFNYPGVVAHVGAIRRRARRGGAPRGRQGPGDLHGDRRSPGTRTAARCSTPRTTAPTAT